MSRKADARVQPEAYGKKRFDGKKRSNKEDGKRNDAASRRRDRAENPANDKKKGKPSREERGYTKARGKKDDWKQFFQGNNDFKDAEPDSVKKGGQDGHRRRSDINYRKIIG